ncbi:ABC transporter, ATP-binding protein [Fusobacterium necrophorum subsp. funduliforme ATCC 51357]|uniref:ABC transporter ATP-binding protein n=1 Tax=Fusobacterium necrophorum BL TaxID=1441732 RepID=A0AB73BYE0_9FUSO|nr:ABC transporter ATP-binding protein [Fusobacterium necrophorum]AYV93031.1 ABC transporter ATP-binding protein [Fusobacterium necrophorum subsp. funduliforme]EIJ67596.1 ABC transporter, ATP-binding protein [Fusobacterium necrophorum subsp. funduliforme ATCC 51357]KAB0554167.1 ABC transporter ATP-binding protein [Fusobacterium necrophorum subsp. funduliforme]KDE63961.1 ABC transporter ATP-binding protein [Fusobacterium necrophorum BL]KYM45399.1 ABC transporter ATP-binding protein [Fusobacteri
MKKEKKKTSILKRLMPYAGQKGYMLYLAMMLSGISGIMVLMPMLYIHKIIKSIILNKVVDVVMIKQYAVSAALFAAIGLLLYTFALIVSHIFAFEVEDNIIKINVEKMMKKPLGYFLNRESGKIRNVIVDGASQTHSFLAHQLPDMAMSVISPLILLGLFLYFDWRLGVASLIPLIISMGLMATMMTEEMKKEREKYFEDLANLSAETVEYVRGIPVVKTFAQSVESFQRLHSLIIRLKETVMKLTVMYRNKMSLYEAITASTAFFLVPVAILLIGRGEEIRTVLGNSIIYLLLGPTFGMFIMRSTTITQFSFFATTALDNIDNILDYEELSYGEKQDFSEGLEFKNVSFSYGDEKILDQVSFRVNQGESVALVGPSGGGKSTIARLAARFYDADSGEVLLGKTNIQEYEKTALMKKIAFVFQGSKLFKISLKENLLLGKSDASDKEIEDALVSSGSKEIVDTLEKGLETVYGTKGTYFSGGEVQRLTIARAFLKDAKLLILDEATAFADPENEYMIQESFKKLAKNRTTLMIAHRLSTVVNADRILVIDKGKLVEEGTHDELLQKGEVYKKLWEEYQRAVNWKIGGQNA